MIRRLVAMALLSCASVPRAALAGCAGETSTVKMTDVEAGSSSNTLSQARGTWNESYLLAVARTGNTRSEYVRASRNERFDLVDDVYEAGFYTAVAPHVVAAIDSSFSPQHQQQPENTIGTNVDVRFNDGYGYQAGYAARNYESQRTSIFTTGADRYSGNTRVALSISFAGLTNVPGVAAAETVSVARYLACDTLGASVSIGRDVESTGIANVVAVYPERSFDVGDLHWFSKRTAVNAGIGWYLLDGAYGRMEVRVAIRERF